MIGATGVNMHRWNVEIPENRKGDVPSSRILHSRRSFLESSSSSLSILLLLFLCSDSSPLVLMHVPIATINLL
jgi:hypothetical protein